MDKDHSRSSLIVRHVSGLASCYVGFGEVEVGAEWLDRSVLLGEPAAPGSAWPCCSQLDPMDHLHRHRPRSAPPTLGRSRATPIANRRAVIATPAASHRNPEHHTGPPDRRSWPAKTPSPQDSLNHTLRNGNKHYVHILSPPDRPRASTPPPRGGFSLRPQARSAARTSAANRTRTRRQ